MAGNRSSGNTAGKKHTAHGIPTRVRRRRGGGIGRDGKPVAPAIITAVAVILLFTAIYFGTVEGWFGCSTEDPASIDATIPPEVTPLPAMTTALPIDALNDKTLTVYAADVGQGDCTLLMSPNGKTMLVDSGDEAHYEDVSAMLFRFGIKKLDVVVAASAGEGSIGAMARLIADHEIGSFYACSGLEQAGEYAPIAEALQSRGVTARAVSSGSIGWDKSCPTEAYLVQGEEHPCLALRVTHSGYSLLLAGGVGPDSEAQLAACSGIKSEVLFVGANGGEGSASSALLSAVSPTCAVISAGGAGRPSNDALSRLNARGVKLYRTDKNGAVTIVIDKDGIRFK